jgi:hypothetical protein
MTWKILEGEGKGKWAMSVRQIEKFSSV